MSTQLIRVGSRLHHRSSLPLLHQTLTSAFLRVQTTKCQPSTHHQRSLATLPPSIPHLTAHDLLHANHADHISLVASHLRTQGILKITLDFSDPESTYLTDLITNLHQRHGHKLPISHSASRGWFWDVRPATTHFQTVNHQARSETMDEFPWHTDCSYEDPTPRLFALHVLQHDRFGGGTLSVTNVDRLVAQLSESSRRALARPEFRITIPKEFVKTPEKTFIAGKVLGNIQGQSIIRFRQDILTPLTQDAKHALEELNDALARGEILNRTTMHLAAGDLPSGSVVLVDNWRWLHARNDVKDPKRHLRRVRWDAVPFGDGS